MHSAILLLAVRPIANKDILSMKNISGFRHPAFSSSAHCKQRYSFHEKY